MLHLFVCKCISPYDFIIVVRIDTVMVSMLATSVVDCGLEPQ